MNHFFNFLLVATLLTWGHLPLAAQIYVDATATGANDGSSWGDAYATLHEALEDYNAGDEIWVAAGTYVPQQPSAWTGSPKTTFYLHREVSLYGGFNGTETQRTQRDPANNVTILSGDLNGDDLPNDFATNRNDNVINVVYVDSLITNVTVIDGFTISGGHADSASIDTFDSRGGGLWSWGSPQVRQCRFTHNYALAFGGGMYLRGQHAAQAVVSDCVFEQNKADVEGGGLTIFTFDLTRAVQASHCRFVNNQAGISGGGVTMGRSAASFVQCDFEANRSGLGGGGINVGGSYDLTMHGCAFEANVSTIGGGFYSESIFSGKKYLRLDSCTFLRNEALDGSNVPAQGGGMAVGYTGGTSVRDSILIYDCLFQKNTSEQIGGGVLIVDAVGQDNVVDVRRTQFRQNFAARAGGGLDLVYIDTARNSELTVSNCEFDANRSNTAGGFIFENNSQGGHDLRVDACTFLNNATINANAQGGAMAIGYVAGAPTHDSVTITNCLFGDNTSEQFVGGLLVLDGVGQNNVLAVQNCVFRKNTAPILAGGVALAYYNDAANCQFSIQDCDFVENTARNGGGFYFESGAVGQNHIELKGSQFRANEALPGTFSDPADGGAVNAVYFSQATALDSFLISDCRFEMNTSAGRGAGVSLENRGSQRNAFSLFNNEFLGNHAQGGGGGLFFDQAQTATEAHLAVLDCRFQDNRAASGAGMLYQNRKTGFSANRVTISRTDWIDNEALSSQPGPGGSGGLSFHYLANAIPQQDTVRVFDCHFQGNTAASGAGGLGYTHLGGVDNHLGVQSCVFIANQAASTTGAGGLGIVDGGMTYSARVEQTHFRANVGQGTAAFGVSAPSNLMTPSDRRIELVNCLFTEHHAHPNSSAVLSTDRTFDLRHCTVADNQVPSLRLDDSATVSLQNSIFDAPNGVNLVMANPATVSLSSLGGNLFSDAAFDAYRDSTDQSSLSALLAPGLYQPLANSPAIDAGVVLGDLPAVDLLGNPRVQGGCLDIGAIESGFDRGLGCVATNPNTGLLPPPTAAPLSLYPNPAVHRVTVSLPPTAPTARAAAYSLRIIDATGQVVQTATLAPQGSTEVDVRALPAGTYRVLVSDGQQIMATSLIKSP